MSHFIKNKEDFVCQKCGQKVSGDGFTNHCPSCLWSKHVDIDPGDRAESCGGMMEPVDLVKEGDIFKIVHKCIVCGKEKRNKAVEGDNFNKLIEISKNL